MGIIYVKPFVDVFGASQYKVTNTNTISEFCVMLTRAELEDFIKQAEGAMVEVDKFIREHPRVKPDE